MKNAPPWRGWNQRVKSQIDDFSWSFRLLRFSFEILSVADNCERLFSSLAQAGQKIDKKKSGRKLFKLKRSALKRMVAMLVFWIQMPSKPRMNTQRPSATKYLKEPTPIAVPRTSRAKCRSAKTVARSQPTRLNAQLTR